MFFQTDMDGAALCSQPSTLLVMQMCKFGYLYPVYHVYMIKMWLHFIPNKSIQRTRILWTSNENLDVFLDSFVVEIKKDQKFLKICFR